MKFSKSKRMIGKMIGELENASKSVAFAIHLPSEIFVLHHEMKL